jgi:hypothetical protein
MGDKKEMSKDEKFVDRLEARFLNFFMPKPGTVMRYNTYHETYDCWASDIVFYFKPRSPVGPTEKRIVLGHEIVLSATNGTSFLIFAGVEGVKKQRLNDDGYVACAFATRPIVASVGLGMLLSVAAVLATYDWMEEMLCRIPAVLAFRTKIRDAWRSRGKTK